MLVELFHHIWLRQRLLGVQGAGKEQSVLEVDEDHCILRIDLTEEIAIANGRFLNNGVKWTLHYRILIILYRAGGLSLPNNLSALSYISTLTRC